MNLTIWVSALISIKRAKKKMDASNNAFKTINAMVIRKKTPQKQIYMFYFIKRDINTNNSKVKRQNCQIWNL